MTTTALAVHPSTGGRRNGAVVGRYVVDRLLYSNRAAGKANETCCRTMPIPMRALKAKESADKRKDGRRFTCSRYHV